MRPPRSRQKCTCVARVAWCGLWRVEGVSPCIGIRITWVSVREDGAGDADPVRVFMSGARVGGNISPTREGSFPLTFLEKGDEVANHDDSSLMEKGIERPLLSRGNTGSSLAKDLGVLALAFPHFKPTATSWPGRSVLELAFPHLQPTATTWSERGEGEYVRLGGRRAVAAASLLRDAWLGGAAREA